MLEYNGADLFGAVFLFMLRVESCCVVILKKAFDITRTMG